MVYARCLILLSLQTKSANHQRNWFNLGFRIIRAFHSIMCLKPKTNFFTWRHASWERLAHFSENRIMLDSCGCLREKSDTLIRQSSSPDLPHQITVPPAPAVSSTRDWVTGRWMKWTAEHSRSNNSQTFYSQIDADGGQSIIYHG